MPLWTWGSFLSKSSRWGITTSGEADHLCGGGGAVWFVNWGTFVSSANLRNGQKEKARDQSELCCLNGSVCMHSCVSMYVWEEYSRQQRQEEEWETGETEMEVDEHGWWQEVEFLGRKWPCQGWRDGGWKHLLLFRGPNFNSQNIHGSSQNHLNPRFGESNTFFLASMEARYIYVYITYISRQNTHNQKIKINFTKTP